MIIRFVVSNFMSFKGDTEFNMLPSKSKGYRKNSGHISKTNSGIEVLKTASIYGANASGKSNLVRAIEYLKDIVSGEENKNLVPFKKRFRLDPAFKNKSTTFRIEIEHDGYHYDYAIEINKGKIIDEWLYLIESVKNDNETLLYRRINNVVTFGDFFENIDLSYIKKFLEKEIEYNTSAISLIYDNIDDNKLIDNFFLGLDHVCVVTPESYASSYPLSIISGKTPKDFAEKIMKKSNTGIEELIIQNIPVDTFFSYENNDFKNEIIETFENQIQESEVDEEQGLAFYLRGEYNLLRKEDIGEEGSEETNYYVSVLKTKHYNSSELFDFSEESDGTNRLFELIPAFDELLYQKGYTYIVDEVERSMHPILAKELLNLYVSSSNKKSQLIFTTHESHLLDLTLMRQDEIWFCEKKNDGGSTFYPLSEFKPREDKNIRLGYLEGRYGGIPFLGDFSKIVNDAEKKIQT